VFSRDGNVMSSQNSRGELHLWRAPTWDELEMSGGLARSHDDRQDSGTP
jgi:hypothetical protein